MDRKIDAGCYYFPNYHPNDARNAAAHGPGPAIAWSLPMRLRFLERLLPGIPPFLRQDSVGVSSHVPGVCPHLFPRIPQVGNQWKITTGYSSGVLLSPIPAAMAI